MYVCSLGQSVCLMAFVSEVKAKELMISIFAHRRYTHISDIGGVLDGGSAPLPPSVPVSVLPNTSTR